MSNLTSENMQSSDEIEIRDRETRAITFTEMSDLGEIRAALGRMGSSASDFVGYCEDSISYIQKYAKFVERAGVDSRKLEGVQGVIRNFDLLFDDIEEAKEYVRSVYDKIKWIIQDENREIFKRLIQAITFPKEYRALCQENGVDVKKLAEHFDFLSEHIMLGYGYDITEIMELAGFDSSEPGIIKSMIERFKSLYGIISEDDDVFDFDLEKEKKEV